MMHVGMFVFNHCESNSRVMCAKPHNEVLKYFMSRKLHTNTGSSEFLIEGRSLCCGAARTDGPLRLTGAKEPAVPTHYCCPGCLQICRVYGAVISKMLNVDILYI